MKEIKDQTNPKNDEWDRESWKNFWTGCHQSQLNDPDQRDLYLDYVEVMTELCCFRGHTEILGRDFFTFWLIQETFLKWLKLYLNRGLGFEEAWFLAMEALTRTEEGRGVTYENSYEIMGDDYWMEYEQYLEWYLDDEIYRPRIEQWTEALINFGISEDKAVQMAEELITLLREISFEQRIRPADFWVGSGGSVNVA